MEHLIFAALLIPLLIGVVVTAPLFSFGASGQIGKAIVYGTWKGLNWVRKYVIPTNPNTTDQQTQRGYMTNAVAEFHAALYNALDVIMWNALANILAGALSGFNSMVRYHIAEVIAGGTWTRIHLASVHAISSTGFVARVYCGTGQPVFHYGTSPTFMPNTPAVIPAGPANQFEADLGGLLVTKTNYYYYWHYGTAGANYGRTGIDHVKTT